MVLLFGIFAATQALCPVPVFVLDGIIVIEVIFNGNGMGFRWDQWSGQKDLRVVIGMYFVNSGSADMSFKYYTEDNGFKRPAT